MKVIEITAEAITDIAFVQNTINSVCSLGLDYNYPLRSVEMSNLGILTFNYDDGKKEVTSQLIEHVAI